MKTKKHFARCTECGQVDIVETDADIYEAFKDDEAYMCHACVEAFLRAEEYDDPGAEIWPYDDDPKLRKATLDEEYDDN